MADGATTPTSGVLRRWGDVVLTARASGGSRNHVWFAVVNGRDCVVRASTRPGPAIEWELDVLAEVRAHGLGAPAVVPTRTGERVVDGVTVVERVAGEPPRTDDDWRRVAAYLRDLHGAFAGWRQRPGFASAADLLTRDGAGDVDLAAMPPEAVARCRAAWAALPPAPRTVVHGDPGASNVLLAAGGVVLVDWDEARVDVPAFDLAALPDAACPLAEPERHMARRAASAWEAAVSWLAEPDYAMRRLAELG